jgi:hypothetical protein
MNKCLLSYRQVNGKSSSNPGVTINLDKSIMNRNDFFTNGQPDSRAFKFQLGIQPGEGFKYFRNILFGDANSIVRYMNINP